MAGPIRGSGIPGAPWRGCQYRSLTSAGGTFVVDGSHLVYRVVVFETAGDGALATLTVTIQVENTVIYSGVPIPMLQTPIAGGVASGTAGVVVWEPLRPIRFNPSWPITITPSAACDVLFHAVESQE